MWGRGKDEMLLSTKRELHKVRQIPVEPALVTWP